MIKIKKLNSQAMTGAWAIKVNTIHGHKMAFTSNSFFRGLFNAIVLVFTH
jgi:hypothetical protein